MNAKRVLLATFLLTATALLPAQAQTSGFPNKPIHIVVPFAAGSSADDNSRFYAELMQKTLKVPVIVENKPGGAGEIGASYVKAQPADGYTLLMGTNSTMALNPVMKKNLSYDAFADFRPVHGLQVTGAILVVPSDGPAKTVADLLKLAKTEKRSLAVGNYSDGYKLMGDWLGHEAKVEVNHVPYKGANQMLPDLVGRRLDAAFIDAAGVQQMINAGKLRGLAITDGKRDAKFPDVPTMKELGYADFETYVWTSFYAPAKTPDAVVQKLADTVRDALKTPESKARVSARPGREMNLHTTALGDFQRADAERYKKVLQATGL